MVAATKTASRVSRASTTRELILSVAERLYAERGVFAVSNRQVSEAAEQGNNAAVGYHFGTKTDLVRAIVVKHAQQVDVLRQSLVEQNRESTDLRDWVTCLVRPTTDHLAALGNPTWFARFNAQVMTDPTLRSIVYEEVLASSSLKKTRIALGECLPDIPSEVRVARGEMARTLMTHVTADRERMFAEAGPGADANWYDCGTGLIDALVGMWRAPVSCSSEYSTLPKAHLDDADEGRE